MQAKPLRSFSSTAPFQLIIIDNSDITTCLISQSENGVVKIIFLFGHLLGRLKGVLARIGRK